MMLNIFEKAIEVKPVGEEGFRKIKETLTRMGVASRREKALSQSAHILHKQGQFYIMHFKEMMMLDGLNVDFTDSDIARRNRISQMLSDWGLLEIVNPHDLEPIGSPKDLKVLKYSEK